MRFILRGAFCFALALAMTARADERARNPITIVIHGGAGTLTRTKITAEQQREYHAALSTALKIGFDILQKGGTSLDAVEAAVRSMEDSPLFNAGKGAVFTHDGRNELDASIMDGRTLKAGAVAGVTIIKNPITAARAVMEKSSHVLLTGRGAEMFAASQGLETVDPSYFWTKRRWDDLQKALAKEKATSERETPVLDEKLGTVGAVALDSFGNLAAATSTGGTTNKRWGRVGDSPLIGAGTYANNASCAVSATGTGEFFIRYVVAHDIAALIEYKNYTPEKAADEVINTKLRAIKGDGGVIVLDAKGRMAMTFNTEGMYRGYIAADGEVRTFIFGD